MCLRPAQRVVTGYMHVMALLFDERQFSDEPSPRLEFSEQQIVDSGGITIKRARISLSIRPLPLSLPAKAISEIGDGGLDATLGSGGLPLCKSSLSAS
jgi:hypothetical protein